MSILSMYILISEPLSPIEEDDITEYPVGVKLNLILDRPQQGNTLGSHEPDLSIFLYQGQGILPLILYLYLTLS